MYKSVLKHFFFNRSLFNKRQCGRINFIKTIFGVRGVVQTIGYKNRLIHIFFFHERKSLNYSWCSGCIIFIIVISFQSLTIRGLPETNLLSRSFQCSIWTTGRILSWAISLSSLCSILIKTSVSLRNKKEGAGYQGKLIMRVRKRYAFSSSRQTGLFTIQEHPIDRMRKKILITFSY